MVDPFVIEGAGAGSYASLAAWRTRTGFDAHSTFSTTLPGGVDIKVKRNTESVTGRAYVTIINWPAIGGIPHNEISFNPNADGPILTNGDLYQILNAQNPFGAPVLTGTYRGGDLSIDLSGLSIEQPLAAKAPVAAIASTPEFGVFIVEKVSAPMKLSGNFLPLKRPTLPSR